MGLKSLARPARWCGHAALTALVVYSALLLAWPLGWVPELAHEARWQAGWFGVIATLLLALAASREPRAWRAAAVALVLSAVHLTPGIALWFGREDDPGHGARLTVAEVNLWHSNKRADLVSEWLRRDAPDVVVCFEVSTFWTRELDALADVYPFRTVVPAFELDPVSRARRGTVPDKVLEREAEFPARWGTALLSKRPIEDLVVHTVPRSPDPYVEATVTVDGTRFHLVAVHPERPGVAPRTPRRNALLDHVARETAWTPTSVVAGDLNATIHAPVYRRFVEGAGLKDAAHGFGRLPTWSWFPGNGWKWLDLDHVLVREGLVVLEARVGPKIGSDHRPLIVRLRAR